MSPCRNPGCISTFTAVEKTCFHYGEPFVVRFCSDTCLEEWLWTGDNMRFDDPERYDDD